MPTRRRAISIAALALLTAASVATFALRGASTVRFEVLSPDDPVVGLNREIEEQFGMLNPLVWVLAGRDGTIWTTPALTNLRDLTREVLRIPGVIATEVVSLGSPNVRDLAVSESSLGATYLLGTIPTSDAEIKALRSRVEANPNFRGSLVSVDGRAAMVVADFRSDADAEAVAKAALELRDRFRDQATDVWVAGAAVLERQVASRAIPLVAAAAAIALAGFACLAWLVGIVPASVAVLAGVLAVVWTAASLALAGSLFVPWTVYAALPVAVTAAALSLCGVGPADRAVALALAVGFAALAAVADGAARSVGLAGVIGTVTAFAVAHLLPVSAAAAGFRPRWRDSALLVLLFCLLGLTYLGAGFGSFGYGARYLPAAAAADLRAVGSYFPPPSALAIRVRGEAGFVRSPELVRTLDHLTEVARTDGAVARAMSLADLVKMVNRSFNDGLPEFDAVPDDPATIGRYLTMAYSPGFRRFVDRAFSQTALWVYLAGDDPSDLDRVRDTLQASLARSRPAGAVFDLFGGDGAVALRTAELARSVVLGWLAFTVAAALVLALTLGPALAVKAAAGALAAAGLCGGILGWFGVPVDLVTLAALGAATAIGLALTALGGALPLTLAMAASAPVAVLASYLSGSLLGYVVAVPLLAPLIVGALLPAWPERDGGKPNSKWPSR